ncbi:hypothetical protein MferCBS31731_005585 [Microsporum ferrugineum]
MPGIMAAVGAGSKKSVTSFVKVTFYGIWIPRIDRNVWEISSRLPTLVANRLGLFVQEVRVDTFLSLLLTVSALGFGHIWNFSLRVKGYDYVLESTL